MNAWNVYHNGKWLDTVHFSISCLEDDVRKSLIDHDGFPADITVSKKSLDTHPDFLYNTYIAHH